MLGSCATIINGTALDIVFAPTHELICTLPWLILFLTNIPALKPKWGINPWDFSLFVPPPPCCPANDEALRKYGRNRSVCWTRRSVCATRL